ncbi:hypothetical protein [Nonomuraea sp. NPDC050202]|uniref:hypothetical protein n=1 Tax=Nonomuraea sp. NPDC050202 TaxID=3155035 RepID=UPI0033ED4349
MWQGDDLVGFVDWDTAGPFTRERDLAYVALTWVPLHARHVVVAQGFTAFEDRYRRLHLLLDAYGYEGDRSAFGLEVADRAQKNAEFIRRHAEGGEQVFRTLLPFAVNLEQAVAEIEELPDSFWVRA